MLPVVIGVVFLGLVAVVFHQRKEEKVVTFKTKEKEEKKDPEKKPEKKEEKEPEKKEKEPEKKAE